MNPLRRGLPPLPRSMRRLPVDARGYPVPFFVAWLDPEVDPVQATVADEVPPGEGIPDFRIMRHDALDECIERGACWTCGSALSAHKSYVIGPMCAVNRTSAEPPSHPECARFSALACPFLTRPKALRRTANLPPERVMPAGIMIERNPGATAVWTIRGRARGKPDSAGHLLFDLGEPAWVEWYAEGRLATRHEIVASIESGLPLLREMCRGARDHRALDEAVERALVLAPAA